MKNARRLLKSFLKSLVLIALVLRLSGSAFPSDTRLPGRDIAAYENVESRNGLSVAVEIFGKKRSEEIFGLDLRKKRIQPIYVIIKNESVDKYWFSKAGCNKNVIPAREVPRRVYEGALGRFLRGGTLGMLKWPFMIPSAVVDKSRSAAVRGRMKREAEEAGGLREIPDVHIKPNEEIDGVMFVPVAEDNRYIVKITNSRNLKKEEFVFLKEGAE